MLFVSLDASVTAVESVVGDVATVVSRADFRSSNGPTISPPNRSVRRPRIITATAPAASFHRRLIFRRSMGSYHRRPNAGLRHAVRSVTAGLAALARAAGIAAAITPRAITSTAARA